MMTGSQCRTKSQYRLKTKIKTNKTEKIILRCRNRNSIRQIISPPAYGKKKTKQCILRKTRRKRHRKSAESEGIQDVRY